MAGVVLVEPPVEPPLSQAVRALANLDSASVAEAVWIRLMGDAEAFGLPALHPQEERVAIFVQVYEYGDNGQVNRNLRQACVSLLDQHKETVYGEDLSQRWALGEVCYLSARIQSLNALKPLLEIAFLSRHFNTGERESFLRRVLGSLIGILGSVRGGGPGNVEQATRIFEECLELENCRLLALTGLIGLWPERRSEYLGRVPINEEDLDVNLTLAGFLPLETLEARWPKVR
ncbi:MAG TPA: hypothetical protein VMF91_00900 [Bryobacteraceae bacterium]|nr:hypothetical protein [Bryobacteraceae bacterium]